MVSSAVCQYRGQTNEMQRHNLDGNEDEDEDDWIYARAKAERSRIER